METIIEKLLLDRMNELHAEVYPTDKQPVHTSIESVRTDYFPLHMVKTVCERFAIQCIDETIEVAKCHMDSPEDFDDEGTKVNVLKVFNLQP